MSETAGNYLDSKGENSVAPHVKRWRRISTDYVEALRYLGDVPGLDEAALKEWGVLTERHDDGHLYIWVEKSCAYCKLPVGSWVIQEADGHSFYPCWQTDFWRTYEEAE
jgi:hypothetical protein